MDEINKQSNPVEGQQNQPVLPEYYNKLAKGLKEAQKHITESGKELNALPDPDKIKFQSFSNDLNGIAARFNAYMANVRNGNYTNAQRKASEKANIAALNQFRETVGGLTSEIGAHVANVDDNTQSAYTAAINALVHSYGAANGFLGNLPAAVQPKPEEIIRRAGPQYTSTIENPVQIIDPPKFEGENVEKVTTNKHITALTNIRRFAETSGDMAKFTEAGKTMMLKFLNNIDNNITARIEDYVKKSTSAEGYDPAAREKDERMFARLVDSAANQVDTTLQRFNREQPEANTPETAKLHAFITNVFTRYSEEFAEISKDYHAALQPEIVPAAEIVNPPQEQNQPQANAANANNDQHMEENPLPPQNQQVPPAAAIAGGNPQVRPEVAGVYTELREALSSSVSVIETENFRNLDEFRMNSLQAFNNKQLAVIQLLDTYSKNVREGSYAGDEARTDAEAGIKAGVNELQALAKRTKEALGGVSYDAVLAVRANINVLDLNINRFLNAPAVQQIQQGANPVENQQGQQGGNENNAPQNGVQQNNAAVQEQVEEEIRPGRPGTHVDYSKLFAALEEPTKTLNEIGNDKDKKSPEKTVWNARFVLFKFSEELRGVTDRLKAYTEKVQSGANYPDEQRVKDEEENTKALRSLQVSALKGPQQINALLEQAQNYEKNMAPEDVQRRHEGYANITRLFESFSAGLRGFLGDEPELQENDEIRLDNSIVVENNLDISFDMSKDDEIHHVDPNASKNMPWVGVEAYEPSAGGDPVDPSLILNLLDRADGVKAYTDLEHFMANYRNADDVNPFAEVYSDFEEYANDLRQELRTYAAVFDDIDENERRQADLYFSRRLSLYREDAHNAAVQIGNVLRGMAPMDENFDKLADGIAYYDAAEQAAEAVAALQNVSAFSKTTAPLLSREHPVMREALRSAGNASETIPGDIREYYNELSEFNAACADADFDSTYAELVRQENMIADIWVKPDDRLRFETLLPQLKTASLKQISDIRTNLSNDLLPDGKKIGDDLPILERQRMEKDRKFLKQKLNALDSYIELRVIDAKKSALGRAHRREFGFAVDYQLDEYRRKPTENLVNRLKDCAKQLEGYGKIGANSTEFNEFRSALEMAARGGSLSALHSKAQNYINLKTAGNTEPSRNDGKNRLGMARMVVSLTRYNKLLEPPAPALSAADQYSLRRNLRAYARELDSYTKTGANSTEYKEFRNALTKATTMTANAADFTNLYEKAENYFNLKTDFSLRNYYTKPPYSETGRKRLELAEKIILATEAAAGKKSILSDAHKAAGAPVSAEARERYAAQQNAPFDYEFNEDELDIQNDNRPANFGMDENVNELNVERPADFIQADDMDDLKSLLGDQAHQNNEPAPGEYNRIPMNESSIDLGGGEDKKDSKSNLSNSQSVNSSGDEQNGDDLDEDDEELKQILAAPIIRVQQNDVLNRREQNNVPINNGNPGSGKDEKNDHLQQKEEEEGEEFEILPNRDPNRVRPNIVRQNLSRSVDSSIDEGDQIDNQPQGNEDNLIDNQPQGNEEVLIDNQPQVNEEVLINNQPQVNEEVLINNQPQVNNRQIVPSDIDYQKYINFMGDPKSPNPNRVFFETEPARGISAENREKINQFRNKVNMLTAHMEAYRDKREGAAPYPAEERAHDETLLRHELAGALKSANEVNTWSQEKMQNPNFSEPVAQGFLSVYQKSTAFLEELRSLAPVASTPFDFTQVINNLNASNQFYRDNLGTIWDVGDVAIGFARFDTDVGYLARNMSEYMAKVASGDDYPAKDRFEKEASITDSLIKLRENALTLSAAITKSENETINNSKLTREKKDVMIHGHEKALQFVTDTFGAVENFLSVQSAVVLPNANEIAQNNAQPPRPWANHPVIPGKTAAPFDPTLFSDLIDQAERLKGGGAMNHFLETSARKYTNEGFVVPRSGFTSHEARLNSLKAAFTAYGSALNDNTLNGEDRKRAELYLAEQVTLCRASALNGAQGIETLMQSLTPMDPDFAKFGEVLGYYTACAQALGQITALNNVYTASNDTSRLLFNDTPYMTEALGANVLSLERNIQNLKNGNQEVPAAVQSLYDTYTELRQYKRDCQAMPFDAAYDALEAQEAELRQRLWSDSLPADADVFRRLVPELETGTISALCAKKAEIVAGGFPRDNAQFRELIGNNEMQVGDARRILQGHVRNIDTMIGLKVVEAKKAALAQTHRAAFRARTVLKNLDQRNASTQAVREKLAVYAEQLSGYGKFGANSTEFKNFRDALEAAAKGGPLSVLNREAQEYVRLKSAENRNAGPSSEDGRNRLGMAKLIVSLTKFNKDIQLKPAPMEASVINPIRRNLADYTAELDRVGKVGTNSTEYNEFHAALVRAANPASTQADIINLYEKAEKYRDLKTNYDPKDITRTRSTEAGNLRLHTAVDVINLTRDLAGKATLTTRPFNEAREAISSRNIQAILNQRQAANVNAQRQAAANANQPVPQGQQDQPVQPVVAPVQAYQQNQPVVAPNPVDQQVPQNQQGQPVAAPGQAVQPVQQAVEPDPALQAFAGKYAAELTSLFDMVGEEIGINLAVGYEQKDREDLLNLVREFDKVKDRIEDLGAKSANADYTREAREADEKNLVVAIDGCLVHINEELPKLEFNPINGADEFLDEKQLTAEIYDTYKAELTTIREAVKPVLKYYRVPEEIANHLEQPVVELNQQNPKVGEPLVELNQQNQQIQQNQQAAAPVVAPVAAPNPQAAGNAANKLNGLDLTESIANMKTVVKKAKESAEAIYGKRDFDSYFRALDFISKVETANKFMEDYDKDATKQEGYPADQREKDEKKITGYLREIAAEADKGIAKNSKNDKLKETGAEVEKWSARNSQSGKLTGIYKDIKDASNSTHSWIMNHLPADVKTRFEIAAALEAQEKERLKAVEDSALYNAKNVDKLDPIDEEAPSRRNVTAEQPKVDEQPKAVEQPKVDNLPKVDEKPLVFANKHTIALAGLRKYFDDNVGNYDISPANISAYRKLLDQLGEVKDRIEELGKKSMREDYPAAEREKDEKAFSELAASELNRIQNGQLAYYNALSAKQLQKPKLAFLKDFFTNYAEALSDIREDPKAALQPDSVVKSAEPEDKVIDEDALEKVNDREAPVDELPAFVVGSVQSAKDALDLSVFRENGGPIVLNEDERRLCIDVMLPNILLCRLSEGENIDDLDKYRTQLKQAFFPERKAYEPRKLKDLVYGDYDNMIYRFELTNLQNEAAANLKPGADVKKAITDICTTQTMLSKAPQKDLINTASVRNAFRTERKSLKGNQEFTAIRDSISDNPKYINELKNINSPEMKVMRLLGIYNEVKAELGRTSNSRPSQNLDKSKGGRNINH